jgi:hypothetical protein
MVGNYRDTCPFCGAQTSQRFVSNDPHGKAIMAGLAKARGQVQAGRFASAVATVKDIAYSICYLGSPVAAREAHEILATCADHLTPEGRAQVQGIIDEMEGRTSYGKPAAAAPASERPAAQVSGWRVGGILLLALGVIIAGYFFLFFDVSVPVDASAIGIDRVNNIGLMADRQNGIIVGIAIAAAGLALIIVGEVLGSRKPGSVCPACAGAVRPGTKFCPHCGASIVGA